MMHLLFFKRTYSDIYTTQHFNDENEKFEEGQAKVLLENKIKTRHFIINLKLEIVPNLLRFDSCVLPYSINCFYA